MPPLLDKIIRTKRSFDLLIGDLGINSAVNIGRINSSSRVNRTSIRVATSAAITVHENDSNRRISIAIGAVVRRDVGSDSIGIDVGS